jgi:multidrug efflux pump subunit AcrB
MSFNPASWSIKNPLPTIVIFLFIGMVGWFSFRSLGIDDLPNIDIPVVSVTVVQKGASPSELELQVTKKVEDAVAGLGDIKQILSMVRDEVSITSVNFELGTNADRATDEIRNSISQIRQDLPQDAEEPIIEKVDVFAEPVIAYTLSSSQRSVEQLSDLVDREISRGLLQISGVSRVERLGGVDREIRVNLDSQRLQAFNITATQVNEQIRSLNANLPAGRTEIAGSENNVRTIGSAKSVAELKKYRINLSNNDTIPLESLGMVEDGNAEVRQSALLDGKPVVAFVVQRTKNSTVVGVADKVVTKIAELKQQLPQDLQFNLIFDRATAIRASYDATIDDLLWGSLFTIITVGLFLRDWRTTLIAGIALPLSILPTFWVMRTCGYTLNNMTLLGLALALGNLIDDAVCTIEDTDRHLKMGKKPRHAAFEAAKELGLGVLASAATIISVFLPVAFMGGVPGQFFQPFGMTIVSSTIFSSIIAITVTPMLCAYLLKDAPLTDDRSVERRKGNWRQIFDLLRGKRRSQGLLQATQQQELLWQAESWREGGTGSSSAIVLSNNSSLLFGQPEPIAPPPKSSFYRQLIAGALHNRFTVLIFAIVIFVASLQLIPFIPQGLAGSGDSGLSKVLLDLPPGTRLQETETVVGDISKILKENPAVASVFGTAGNDGKVNTASIYVNLLPKEQRQTSQKEFEKQMRAKFYQLPGVRISFQNQGAGGGTKALAIVLKGENVDVLEQTAQNLESQMKQISGLVEVSSSINLVKPEAIVLPDLARATDLGVSVQAIASTASLALIGDNEAFLPKFNLNDRQIPIRVQIDPKERQNINTLKNLQIPSNDGSLVPLSAVAEVKIASGPVEITRIDRSRQVMLEANLQGIALGDALELVNALPALNPLPAGITQEPVAGGEAEIMEDVFTRFSAALGLGVISIYTVLIVLYNSFFYPLAILVALPLSVGGALLALLVTQKELGVYALVGMVLLMGLVTKNAILLVDFAIAGIEEGKSKFQAVLEAGVSRLRPILMTSFSTIAGMIPIALELGADGEVRSPMAIAVIGGFTTSTMLTLVVVPVLFTYLSRKRKIGKREA